DRHHDRSQRHRAGEQQRRARERHAISTSGACPGGVQRAGPAPVAHCAPRSGTGRPVWPCTASAKWFARRLGVRAAAAAETPAASAPVTSQVGDDDPCAVAATSPAPAPSVRTTWPWGSRSASEWPSSPLNRAYTPLADGPCAIRMPANVPCSSLHVPTRTASESVPDPVPSNCVAAGTPAALSSAATCLHASDTSGAHSSVVGSRRPLLPCTNGSGNDPTTAGTESVALQSCKSHQMRSPRCTAVPAAPTLAWIPL